MNSAQKYVVWFSEVDKSSIAHVGGKGANLGEMTQNHIPVPDGFIVTSEAYYLFLQKSGLKKEIHILLDKLDVNNATSLRFISKKVRNLIISAPVPKEIALLISQYYLHLSQKSVTSVKKSFLHTLTKAFKPTMVPVAVRSSATAEDLPDASFAGQQATFLNVKGEANVVLAVRKAWASLFTARAIFYRENQKYDHFKVGIAVPVQQMVNSEVSGVMFTVDPLTNNKENIIIEAIYGLGELIVQGAVTPDQYIVKKDTLSIIKKTYAHQTVYMPGTGKSIVNLNQKLHNKPKLTNEQIREVAMLGKKLEHHYYFPQDIEWALENNIIFIVQTRPITTLSVNEKTNTNTTNELKKMKIISKGDPASPGIASGPVTIVKNPSFISQVKEGDVLVAEQTNPDYVPAMKKATAIVTQKGGRTSHAAIVSRELGLPAIVGAENILSKVHNKSIITVDGTTGTIYQGALAKQFKEPSLDRYKRPTLTYKTATKIYTNLAEVERVSEVSKMDVDGIGLLRAEFMLASIGVHPKYIIKTKKQTWYIKSLADKLAIFCKSFDSHRPVIYRATDFKTNEYKNLKHGLEYEQKEENPMLGFRGASRYVADPSCFELELEAIKMVRNKMGYKNLHLMIPFVRSPQELLQTKRIIASSGLLRSSHFKLYLMVELPVNVLLIDDFLSTGVDGISIGSNDLTQLILGVDRDNSQIAKSFNEMSPAVLWSIEHVISACHKHKVTSSICGQAPSDYPELIDKLVKWGITSISVNPDVLYQVRERVWKAETKILNKK